MKYGLDQVRAMMARMFEGKLHSAEFSFPAMSVLLPWFGSALAGFLLASLVGWAVAFTLMPKPRRGASPAGGTEGAIGIDGFDQSPRVRLPVKPEPSQFEGIAKRNLFDSSGVGADAASSSAECVPQKSALPLKVVGIIYGGRPDASLVLLESTATQQVDSFVLGESVPGNARVSDITRDKVFFIQGLCPEYLAVEQPQDFKRRVADPSRRTKATTTGGSGDADFSEDGFERRGDQINVDKQWIEKAIGVDFAKTLQDAKATPHVVAGGQVRGFVMTQIRPESVYEKMGMVNGDIVRSINGIELNDAARAIQTLQAMRTETQLEVVWEREGKQMVRKIQVK